MAMPMSKVHGLSAELETALAAQFSELNPAPFGRAPKQLEDTGKEIYGQGAPNDNVPACQVCHGPRAEGAGPVPRLAGQLYLYTVKELENWDKEPGAGGKSRYILGHAADRSQLEQIPDRSRRGLSQLSGIILWPPIPVTLSKRRQPPSLVQKEANMLKASGSRLMLQMAILASASPQRDTPRQRTIPRFRSKIFNPRSSIVPIATNQQAKDILDLVPYRNSLDNKPNTLRINYRPLSTADV